MSKEQRLAHDQKIKNFLAKIETVLLENKPILEKAKKLKAAPLPPKETLL